MRCLLLFDIDGTLISSQGKAFAALLKAFQQVVGAEPPVEGFSPAGKTDPQIVAELLDRVATDHRKRNQLVAEVLAAYLETLPEVVKKPHVRLLPGVAELLPVLAEDPQVALGLLTGNIREGAQFKLELAGLWHYFAFGAFGSDCSDRNQLLPYAWERAHQRFGVRFSPERTVIVGDTPADVSCAKAWDAKAIAVAGHTFTAARLLPAHPDGVLPSLSPELFLPVCFSILSRAPLA